MAEMINKPEILHKVIQEIKRVVGKQRLVQESDIPKLNYLKSILREAFRLHSVATFNLPHVSLSEITIVGYGLDRNPKVWYDPLSFKPERHLNDQCLEVTLTENDLRFISFSTGKRGFDAPTLGTMITTMMLARLLQGSEWRLVGGETHVELIESANRVMICLKSLVLVGELRYKLKLR